jgi:signal transduction histidine kinase
MVNEPLDAGSVALFTYGPLLLVIFLSTLTLRQWVPVAASVLAFALEALMLWRIDAARPIWLVNSALLTGAATAAALLAMGQLRRLIVRVAQAAEERERGLEEQVRQRTADLDRRNGELEQALSSLRSTQDELVRAERAASVATLVAGLAHELNNPVGFIAGNMRPLERYADFLARVSGSLADGRPRSREEVDSLLQLAPGKDLAFVLGDLKKLTTDVLEGARRAQLIVRDLQSLAAGSNRPWEEVDLHEVVRHTISLYSAKLEGLKLSLELQDVPRVAARAGHLDQVFTNLLDNAVRAVGPGGRIEVGVRSLGDEVELSVRDDGCGMNEDALKRACQPFFTTRPAGQGSGLGLAVVSSIVEAMGGKLLIDSSVGAGTLVRVVVPEKSGKWGQATLGK